MSIPCLAQREDQQQLERIGGSVFSVLLDAEVFLLLSGSALVWADDEEYELPAGLSGNVVPRPPR
ncbi:hypothetical protein ABZ915_44005 [Streptomyces sp. NPDC046915]|uniref:hypothetical protein n=1 Tax=Streptomyces sp. NPDC046915 TaxID=3155257 RepID=UPI003410A18C